MSRVRSVRKPYEVLVPGRLGSALRAIENLPRGTGRFIAPSFMMAGTAAAEVFGWVQTRDLTALGAFTDGSLGAAAGLLAASVSGAAMGALYVYNEHLLDKKRAREWAEFERRVQEAHDLGLGGIQ